MVGTFYKWFMSMRFLQTVTNMVSQLRYRSSFSVNIKRSALRLECVTITVNWPLSVNHPHMHGNVTKHGQINHIIATLPKQAKNSIKIILTFKSTASAVRRTISYGSSPLSEGEKGELRRFL